MEPGSVNFVDKSVLAEFSIRLGRGEPFKDAWLAANGFLSPIDDAVPMTKAEIIRRREQGHFQHLLATDQLFRLVLVSRGLF